MTKLEKIEFEALELNPQDRALLVEKLIHTLDEGQDEDVEELWLQEAERRYVNYRQGKTSAKPADQVILNAYKNL